MRTAARRALGATLVSGAAFAALSLPAEAAAPLNVASVAQVNATEAKFTFTFSCPAGQLFNYSIVLESGQSFYTDYTLEGDPATSCTGKRQTRVAYLSVEDPSARRVRTTVSIYYGQSGNGEQGTLTSTRVVKLVSSKK